MIFTTSSEEESEGDGTRFLSAFESTAVLCPELANLGAADAASVSPKSPLHTEWTLMFGGKAADLLSRPRVPQLASALLHPSLAALYFEKLLAQGADSLTHDKHAFLTLAENTFRRITVDHCLGETFLPIDMRFDVEAETAPLSPPPSPDVDSDVTRRSAAPQRFLLRSSHVLESAASALSGVFESVTIGELSEIPRAVALITLSYFRAPLEEMLEDLSPEVHLYPGNFLLQPLVETSQAGILRVVTSTRPSSWAWQLSLDEASCRALTGGDTDARVFQGHGREELARFFTPFPQLEAAFDAYARGGQDIVVEWGVVAKDGQLRVFQWLEAETPDPGRYTRAGVRTQFPRALSPLSASLARQALPVARLGVREFLPLAQGHDADFLRVDARGWVFARTDFLKEKAFAFPFRASAHIARAFGERAAAWSLALPLKKLVGRWHEFLEESGRDLGALRDEFERDGSAAVPSNQALVSLIERIAMLQGEWRKFGIPIAAWRAYLEEFHTKRLRAADGKWHLETASNARALLLHSPYAHAEPVSDASAWELRPPPTTGPDANLAAAESVARELAPRGAPLSLEERERALASAQLTTLHALILLMAHEHHFHEGDAVPLTRRVLAVCADRLGLDDTLVHFLTFSELRTQLQTLETDLQAAGLAQPRLEHRARLRRERQRHVGAEDPAGGFAHALVRAEATFGESGVDMTSQNSHTKRAKGENDSYEIEDEGPVASDLVAPAHPGPYMHLRTNADLERLVQWPQGLPKPVVVTSIPHPWLARYLTRVAGIVSVRGNALCHLGLVARVRGVPAAFGVEDAFEKFPDETR